MVGATLLEATDEELLEAGAAVGAGTAVGAGVGDAQPVKTTTDKIVAIKATTNKVPLRFACILPPSLVEKNLVNSRFICAEWISFLRCVCPLSLGQL